MTTRIDSVTGASRPVRYSRRSVELADGTRREVTIQMTEAQERARDREEAAWTASQDPAARAAEEARAVVTAHRALITALLNAPPGTTLAQIETAIAAEFLKG